MNRLYLLGIGIVVLILLVSGCGLKNQPSDGKPQSTVQEAGDSANGAAANTASPQGEAKPPSEAAPDAAKPTEAAAEPAPGISGPVNSKAAKPSAEAPSTDAASQAAPAADAAQPSAAAVPPGQTQPAPVSSAAPETAALKISITGDKKRGAILKDISVPFQEGMTVMDALKQATKDNKIQMEYQGKGTYAYVQGIDNLYEFDEGPKSGWVYKVNDSAPGKGAGSYKVAAGDKVEWLYTLDMGEDIGAKIQ